ncbi:hypothetical protein GUJ93_ZPchr0004g38343 [Zizania palustris]|uniref:40S ribosomal protein S7 n=1 Tax=Zizania palustris TaxID=103762 RepID=A0A8J5RZL1_ZIZPA|nr:hypothetical protein GUJ93_ZPchr0004g38343 [Zizania palustris]
MEPHTTGGGEGGEGSRRLRATSAFVDLENGNQELKSELKDLYINNAVQMDVSMNKKAVVIHVPYRLRKAFKKIHVRLVRELEKKFSGKVIEKLSGGAPDMQMKIKTWS